ncbi:MAG: A/G-specific adenine glycosylase [Ignavibacteria bacterium]|nr:A/G-specific adenine glycosylase [Ignavibacteria bacterium]
MLSGKDSIRIRSALLQWYRKNYRTYPWRNPNATPYLVMVSEIMLQQTQAYRVAKLLPHFINRFPTVQALSDAATAEVIMAWRGLGYNNRAVRLRDAARIIVRDFEGNIPPDEYELRKLPGFGNYTAAAVATFVFGVKTVVIDVNIRRVGTRLLTKDAVERTSGLDGTLAKLLTAFIQDSDPSEWYQAMMDLGSTICKARQAECGICPLQHHCVSAHSITASNTKLREPRRREQTFMGRPNRFWRGALVELLRSNSNGITKNQALRALQLNAADKTTCEWFDGIVAALAKDGMLVSARGRLHFAD